MGYYVGIVRCDFVIPGEHEAEALQALKDLNKRDDLKTGGSWGPNGKEKVWFAWMPEDYDKTVTSVREVFDLLGFDTLMKNGDTELVMYDNKTGAEEHFLAVVAPFVKEGSYIEWRGEDGARWMHIVRNGKLETLEGRTVYE